MASRIADSISPYLRAHADNPVDWFPWGEAAFDEAARRDVPVFISIGYSTCHWCHVMARESFSDPAVAARLNDGFVSVKVDREEHPDVDASYLAAASAFTPQLGWPLSVFATPGGRTFYAGTYFPPSPVGQVPAFRSVLDAVLEAFSERRQEVETSAAGLVDALASAAAPPSRSLPTADELDLAATRLAAAEDAEHGGFGGAPKFPVAPVLNLLLARGANGDEVSRGVASRALVAMAGSPLRDPVEGGFFRYAVRRDWSEPHYERMLYDNAQLLDAYAALAALDRDDSEPVSDVAAGIAGFLTDTMLLPSGGFASAQDSESVIDGERNEGGYYARSAEERVGLSPPALDDKVLAGWNGLAIGALAEAGRRLARADWVDAARSAADRLIELHLLGGAGHPGRLARVSRNGVVSPAVATLEDYGLLASGLLRLGLVLGETGYAQIARELVDHAASAVLGEGAADGGDPVLSGLGIRADTDTSEGALPAGRTAFADAALRVHAVTGQSRYRELAERSLAPLAAVAVANPVGYGAALTVLQRLGSHATQLVVVTDDADGELARLAAEWVRVDATVAVVTAEQARAFADAGFELFEARSDRGGEAAYLCQDFVCALPVTTAGELSGLLARSASKASSIH